MYEGIKMRKIAICDDESGFIQAMAKQCNYMIKMADGKIIREN